MSRKSKKNGISLQNDQVISSEMQPNRDYKIRDYIIAACVVAGSYIAGLYTPRSYPENVQIVVRDSQSYLRDLEQNEDQIIHRVSGGGVVLGYSQKVRD